MRKWREKGFLSFLLPLIQHLLHLLMGELHVLHRGGGVAVAELALGGSGVAGLLDEVDAHRMAGRVGGAVFDMGELADLVPDSIDDGG